MSLGAVSANRAFYLAPIPPVLAGARQPARPARRRCSTGPTRIGTATRRSPRRRGSGAIVAWGPELPRGGTVRLRVVRDHPARFAHLPATPARIDPDRGGGRPRDGAGCDPRAAPRSRGRDGNADASIDLARDAAPRVRGDPLERSGPASMGWGPAPSGLRPPRHRHQPRRPDRARGAGPRRCRRGQPLRTSFRSLRPRGSRPPAGSSGMRTRGSGMSVLASISR